MAKPDNAVRNLMKDLHANRDAALQDYVQALFDLARVQNELHMLTLSVTQARQDALEAGNTRKDITAAKALVDAQIKESTTHAEVSETVQDQSEHHDDAPEQQQNWE